MNIFYNIWGITNDFGYKASILKSKNFNESILSSLNESFSDKNRNMFLLTSQLLIQLKSISFQ